MTAIDRAALDMALCAINRWACWNSSVTWASVPVDSLAIVQAAARAHLDTLPKTKTVWRVEWMQPAHEDFPDKETAVARQADLCSHHDYRDVHVTGPHVVPA